MDPGQLSEIGLTEGEAKVYLTMVRLGQTKTGAIASEAGVSSSKVYKILDRLEQKGLAGHVTRGKVKYFSALPARRLLDYMDEKAEELAEKRRLVEELLPTLEAEKNTAQKPEAAVYEGFKAVTNLFRGMLDELRKGETYYVIGAGYGDTPNLREFFYGHHKRRSAKGIRVKMLANFDEKNKPNETAKLPKLVTPKLSEIRYLPQYLITNMEIVFYKNKAIIALWTTEPKGFLIESGEAVKSFEKYFNAFWKTAKS
ncbi:hypothetical protein HZC09_03380 [Candidatus Micrarchaeota archaeon]|nr:hypothetical protein [Candidatus Micrarchaeota archaeon]